MGKELYEKIRRNPRNVRFKELCKCAESFGFKLRGKRGSHRIYVRKGIMEMLNFQNVKGMVKSYQVRQFLKFIKKYRLQEGKNV